MADTRFLIGPGEMAARLRTCAWIATARGPPSQWPRALKTLVGVMLAAKQPMFLAWDAARTMLYNDADAPLAASPEVELLVMIIEACA